MDMQAVRISRAPADAHLSDAAARDLVGAITWYHRFRLSLWPAPGIACFHDTLRSPGDARPRQQRPGGDRSWPWSYPRARPALSAAHERIYLEEDPRNRGTYGGALFRVTAGLERAGGHRRIARRQTGGRLLELGAGTLNHLQYEPAMDYDIVEPLPALYQGSADRGRVARAYASIADIPQQTRYARIISVAVLEHVEDCRA